VAVVDLEVVASPLIHEAVAVGLTEAVGPTFEAEEAEGRLVEALVVVGNRGGKLSKCNQLSEGFC
jgi:hypothetical protein